jgi:cytochrome P450
VQTLEWILRPERFMRRCARRHGNTFAARLGPRTQVVFLSDPAAVRAVFHGSPEQMNMGDINGLFRRVLGRNSLLVIDGEEHLRQRRMLLPPFRGEEVLRHEAAMVAATEEDLERWPEGAPFALQPRMQSMTLNVILGAVFGLQPGPRRDELRGLLARLLELNTTLATTLPQLRVELGGRSPWGRLMRCTKQVDRALYAEIARRREQPDRPSDVLSLMLAEGMSDIELRDQLLTMLVAGHETTATALAWAFERILRHPAVLDRIRAELAERDTSYLEAAIKESLRLRPVVPITARKLTAPFELDGHTYAAGTVLMPCIYLLHRNPGVYDEPEEFRPERFLGRQPEPYAWIPFGGGARRCIGSSFALAEMRAVMSTVLARMDLTVAEPGDEAIVRRAFTLSPANGATVMATRRRRGGRFGRPTQKASSGKEIRVESR